MKSVGEVMAIGRTFKEALGKGIRSLETGKKFGSDTFDSNLIPKKLITPTPDRLSYLRFAFNRVTPSKQIHEMTSIDPWFLEQLRQIVEFEKSLVAAGSRPAASCTEAKRLGISDVQLAEHLETDRNRSPRTAAKT